MPEKSRIPLRFIRATRFFVYHKAGLERRGNSANRRGIRWVYQPSLHTSLPAFLEVFRAIEGGFILHAAQGLTHREFGEFGIRPLVGSGRCGPVAAEA